MLWPPAETRPTFGRYKPAGQNPLISGRLELVGLKKVETHVSRVDSGEMLDASVDSFLCKYEKMEILFDKCLRKIK